MDIELLQEQVDTIRIAFSYIERFKGHTFVIRIDDSLLSHQLFPLLIKDIVLLKKIGIKIVLVPGARQRIDEILETYNLQCEIIGSIRITTAEAMPFVKMAAFDVSNQIMTLLSEENCDAIIGNWVKARRIGVVNGKDFLCSGVIEKIKSDIVQNLLGSDFIPIFPNIGWSATGKPYNISSYELARTVASELNASKLFFITGFGGISASGYRVPADVYISPDDIIIQMSTAQAKIFLEQNSNLKPSESLELVATAYKACLAGVDRVHIIDGRIEGMLLKEIFSDRGPGTMIYSDPYENLRQAKRTDISGILHLMQPFIKEQKLVARSKEDLEILIKDYVVYEVDGTIHGCGALHMYPDNSAEIAGLAVDKYFANFGIGKKIVNFLLEKAKKSGLNRVFLLTTQTADWFLELGFKEADSSSLPEAKRQNFNKARNSLILIYDFNLNE